MANGGLNPLENNYIDMTDEKLVQIVQSNDNIALDYLIHRYDDIVNMKANKFFMIGAEKEDMIQEGYIGLYKAVKSFNFDKQNSFKTFANLCIERQLITAVKNSNRQKHIPLNSSVSLNASAYDDNEDTNIMEVLNTKAEDDPSEIIAKKEYYSLIERKIDESLSDFEKKVLEQYKQGKSYALIAENLGSKVKSIDTAIQRIRKKALKIKLNMEIDDNKK